MGKFLIDEILTRSNLKREFKNYNDYRNFRVWNYDGPYMHMRYKRVECNYCGYDVIYKFNEEQLNNDDGTLDIYVCMDLWFESDSIKKCRHEQAHIFTNDPKDVMDRIKIYTIGHWMRAILETDISGLKLLDSKHEEVYDLNSHQMVLQKWDPFGRDIFHGRKINSTWDYV